MKCKLFFLLSLTITIMLRDLDAQRSIPDDNLGYPVLINLSNCINNVTTIKGSGFFLNTGSEIYLVTARHVLFNVAQHAEPNQPLPLLCKTAELVSYSKDPKDRQQNRTELDLQQLNAGGKVKAHVTKDVAVVQIGLILHSESNQNAKLSATSGVNIITFSASGWLSVAVENVRKYDEVLTANDVYVFGYPSSIGIQQAPQIDYETPLLRKGIVAGTNESNKSIVLDCLTFFGNSGGPVLQAAHVGLGTRFDVIGVISQYVPFTETWVNTTMSYANMQFHNSGYSIAEPMDSVLELVGK